MKSYRISNIPVELEEDDLKDLLGEHTIVDLLAPAANITDSETKKVALVSFGNSHDPLLNKRVIALPNALLTKIGLGRWDLVIDSDFLGLTPMNVPGENVSMDVIAVTGLGGHAFGSWKAKESDFMWLRDALAKDVSGLRILTYGFDSGLLGSTSFASIGSYAKELLRDLIGARSHVDVTQRPLVFICHSLGGLILKQALVAAATARRPGTDDILEPENDVLKSTAGLLLYGVPNRGLRVGSLMPMVRGQPNSELVEALKPESTYLDLLHQNFCTHFTFMDAEIISFWETKLSPTAELQRDGTWKMTGPMEALVSKSSATSSRPNEENSPINSSHSEMVKFKTWTDRDYTFIRDKLKNLRDEAHGRIMKRFSLSNKLTQEDELLGRKYQLTPLILASHKGDVQRVKRLLREGAYVNEMSGSNDTALHHAASKGSEVLVRLLLDSGAMIDAKNNLEQTPLSKAAEEGCDNVVRLLLERGAYISTTAKHGFTPLHFASANGNELVAKVLLDHKPSTIIEALDIANRTPLHLAACRGQNQLVKLLLTRNALERAIDREGDTALHLACGNGHEEVIRELLLVGANIEAINHSQLTPLHIASMTGQKVVVEMLLSRGANIEATAKHGFTPLHCATNQGHDSIVRVLLERSASLEVTRPNGDAALHIASACGKETVINSLLDFGACIEAINHAQLTPLHIASITGQKAVVELLLSRGANIEATSKHGFTPLHHATYEGHDSIVRLLLERSACLEATRPNGDTALHIASACGKETVINSLLDFGACIETKNTILRATPLHLAVIENQVGAASLLLDRGADFRGRLIDRKIPLHISATLGFDRIVSLLLDRGSDIEAKYGDTFPKPPMFLDVQIAESYTLVTSLMLAAACGHTSLCKLLISRGADLEAGAGHCTPLHAASLRNADAIFPLLEAQADIESIGCDNTTPLHWASVSESDDGVRALLDQGANIEAKTNFGWTALHYASSLGRDQNVRALIRRGADVNATDRSRRTPLSLAKAGKQWDTIQLLTEHGGTESVWWRRSPGPTFSRNSRKRIHPKDSSSEQGRRTVFGDTYNTAMPNQYLAIPRALTLTGETLIFNDAGSKRKRDECGLDEDINGSKRRRGYNEQQREGGKESDKEQGVVEWALSKLGMRW